MQDIKNISNVIRYLRMKKGLSQKELGEKCGLTQQAINRIEHGKRSVEFELLIKLANILDLSVSDLVESANELESDKLASIDIQTQPQKWGINGSDSEEHDRNDETLQIAEEIFSNPEMKTLFNVVRDITPEELKEIQKYIEFIKSKRSN